MQLGKILASPAGLFRFLQPDIHDDPESQILLAGSQAQSWPDSVNDIAPGVNKFVAYERVIARHNLLCNIGPDGCLAHGVGAGLVVAAADRADPEYFYTWTRDSALVLKDVVHSMIDEYDAGLQAIIQEYITAQARLQGVPNPSGSLADGAGLGEPKFTVNGTQFTSLWGRPQRDGPALRSISLITYASWLVDNDYALTAADVVWPVIRNDLSYVTQYWNETGFDLWEEVVGTSFFTVFAQYRALIQGDALARSLGKECRSCLDVADNIFCLLQDFWLPENGYILANINDASGRSGKDVNTILASIHAFDSDAPCDSFTFQPCSDRALANHKAVVDSFRDIYTINAGIPRHHAVALGRYPEDQYYGGNPWYLTTLAAAEQLYAALLVWERQLYIDITPVSHPFWTALLPGEDVKLGRHRVDKRGEDEEIGYSRLLEIVRLYADQFVQIVAEYTPGHGSMPEQFSRNEGLPTSAANLTWSYSAFLTAASRRDGRRPPSWISPHAWTRPSVCSSPKVEGTYPSATNTILPPSQTPKGWEPTSTTSVALPTQTRDCETVEPVVAVMFNTLAQTRWGQSISLVGNVEALGDWKVNQSVPLSAKYYNEHNPLWSQTIEFEAGQSLEYRLFKTLEDGTIEWEADPAHTWQVPVGCKKRVLHFVSFQRS